MKLNNVFKLEQQDELDLAFLKRAEVTYTAAQLVLLVDGEDEEVTFEEVKEVLNGVNNGEISIDKIELILNCCRYFETTIAICSEYIDDSEIQKDATELGINEFTNWAEFEPIVAVCNCNEAIINACAGVFYVPEYRWREFERYLKEFQNSGNKVALQYLIHDFCIFGE